MTPTQLDGQSEYLHECPNCNSAWEVRAQTPPDDDDIVRRAYFRCFACGLVSPEVPNWTPVHWRQTGSLPWDPLRDFWNAWAATQ